MVAVAGPNDEATGEDPVCLGIDKELGLERYIGPLQRQVEGLGRSDPSIKDKLAPVNGGVLVGEGPRFGGISAGEIDAVVCGVSDAGERYGQKTKARENTATG